MGLAKQQSDAKHVSLAHTTVEGWSMTWKKLGHANSESQLGFGSQQSATWQMAAKQTMVAKVGLLCRPLPQAKPDAPQLGFGEQHSVA